MKKVRMTVYLDPGIFDKLETYAGTRRQPLSIIAEAAVAAFVDPNLNGADITKRLGRIEKLIDRLGRDMTISVEAFTVYIWLWLNANPPLPEDMAASAKASATDRYDQFMETLGQRLASGQRQALHRQQDILHPQTTTIQP